MVVVCRLTSVSSVTQAGFKMKRLLCVCVLTFLLILYDIKSVSLERDCVNEFCEAEDEGPSENKYTQGANMYKGFYYNIQKALAEYKPCTVGDCTCHLDTLQNDLKPFEKTGISKAMFDSVSKKGTKYQIISGVLYRQKDCHFPARCSGIEHYILPFAKEMPDMELIINTRDWPQLNKEWGHPLGPVFSFSKTKDYYDIMYPAWSFWEGGPAIGLYPTGLGRWDKHRKSLTEAIKNRPWEAKLPKAFFRGSRTSEDRDPIVLLSRRYPELINADYTKNQAWKSNADTLDDEPAKEVPLETHCNYRLLFNYRGVAASFRFKHLFLCKSLVFHVGDEWLEFFYPSLKPWVHYVPVPSNSTQADLQYTIEYFLENDSLSRDIAERGHEHVWNNLKIRDVKCYWKKLLKSYAELLKYDVVRDEQLVEIKPK